MKRIVRASFALALLAVISSPVAAQTAAAREALVGVPFSLRLGEVAVIEGTGILVRFDSVTDDSRCPIDVACVWAGMFRMILVVEDAGQGRTELTLDTLGGEGDAAGLHFALLAVKPARRASVNAAALRYAVLIRADRVQ